MKKIFLSLALSLFALAGFAQTDPTVTNPAMNPGPIEGDSPYTTLSFDFANLGDGEISHLDPDGNTDPIVLKVTLSGGTYDIVHYGDPVAAVGGTYADHFTWSFNAATATYTGVQNQTILGFDGGSITIGYRATVASSSSAPGNGFTVNLTSNGNAPNGPGTNDTTNDAATTATYLDGPLPVTLLSFSVAKEGVNAQLNWATTEETNSDHFEIQHSIGGKEWAKIGKVASNGESTTLKNYTFSHSNPVNGENLYRLKMIDKDLTFAYSRIQNITFAGLAESDLTVYPNPVADKLFLRNFKEITNIQIHNLSGRTVYQAGASNTGEVNVSGLNSGIYIVKINRSNGIESTQKIVVKK